MDKYHPSPNDLNKYQLIFFGMLKFYNETKHYHGKGEIRFSSIYDYESERHLIWEYAKTVKVEEIIEFIKAMFSPNKFANLKYDHDFYNKLEGFMFRSQSDEVQVWSEGPILLKRIKDDENY